jgi:hypothetical protein|nr:MAG: hypothetical protein [Lake Baikal virophage 10]
MSDIQSRQSAQISYLYSQLANIPPTPPPYPTSSDLADVLSNGNSAGASDINMNNNDILNCNNLFGNATSATNIAGGLGGSIPYQSAVNTTALLANGTAGQILQSNGTTLAPSWVTAGSGGGTLQQTLDLGNTATGANAKIGLTNSGVGYTSNPQLTLNNSNATAGNTNGVPSVEYYKSGRNGVAVDVIGSHNFYANNYAGTKTEFAKMEASIRNTGVGNDDGSIGFSGLVNGVQTEFFRVNGADSENNCFLPLDMNGQTIKTSSGNLSLASTASTGTGQITIAPKTGSNLAIGTTPAGTNRTIINADGTGINLQNIQSGFTGVVSLVNSVISQSYLYIQQNFGSFIKYIYVKCDASVGNSLESLDLHTPATPFKIKVDNGSFATSNSSLEIDMNPLSNPLVLAQLTFTHDNTLPASSFTAVQYIPVLIAGTQYYIPITLTPT